ncbi:putative ribonuclease H-like domain-containing protein [Tanacetum coccineum]|uniref:Ribonuclease H-like domain-containing protein n=1 Tax=Tanacetum coccineum TaxID=301880 RepID=A0ABQ5A930_9ASTR
MGYNYRWRSPRRSAQQETICPSVQDCQTMTCQKNQERVKSILLLAIPDEYLLKFYNVPDAKSLSAAIKLRFGGNDESKKMQRNVLKHQFENFSPQMHQMKVWDKAYERETPPKTHKLIGGADEVVRSFFAQQTTSPLLDNEDLQQIDQDDLEELDIRWQVAMLTVRVQRFIQKTGMNLDFKGKQPVTFDKSKVECYNCHKKGHFAKECKSGRNQGKRSYGDNGRRNATTNGTLSIKHCSSVPSDKEVQNCSKQCLESFKTLQKNFDSEREKHSRARLEIQGYELALESLESRILGHEKNELAWGEKYEFQNYKLKCREVKIDNLKMELEKVVKERDELKVKIEKWEESSKGLNKILNSQMSAKDKNGIRAYVRSSDEEITPANDKFSKADGYHAVPPPITGKFLTPRADISFAGLDEYAIRKKIIESKTTELNTDTSKSKISETVGKTNEVNIEKPKSVHESVVPKPKINRDKVIIEDWNSDDEDDVYAIKTVSPVKNNETQMPQARRTFVPSGVLTRTGLVNLVRPNGKRAVHIVSTARPISTVRLLHARLVINMTTAETRAVVNTGKGKMDNALKKSRWVWRPKGNYMDHESKEKGSFILKKFEYGNPESILQGHAVVDSGCSSHMTGNKAYLSDYKDYNGGFVGFGSDPKGGTQEHYVAGSFEKDKEPTQEYSLVNIARPTLSTARLVRFIMLLLVLALESIKDAQAAEISALKSRIKKLEKKCKPSISHHRAWLKSMNRLSMKNKFGKKESVSKQGRKKSKPESTLDDSTVFDDQDIDHGIEYMETKEAVDEGRQSGETEEVKLTDDTEVVEDKGSGDKGGNAEELVSTARPEVSTARPDIDAARQEDSVVEPRTPPTTTSIFDDEDITMAQTLIKMKEEKAKEKGVSIKDVDDSSRPARSILTLKPLPTIDPKEKGKGVLKESLVKKVKRSDLDAAQIAKDAEIARLVHEKELAEMEREREERQRQDQASVDYIASLYDEVQAKMDASEELAARLQMEEREMYTIEERSKLLAEFFERRKKLLAEERAAAVRNKPPTRTQLRSLMMTYLKHTGKYRHNQLNKKTFEEIQALYIKEQERDADFVPIGSERDEKMIDKMNKKAAGMDEEEVPEEPESTKEQLRASLKIVPDEEEEIDYEVLGTRYPIVNWESAFYHTYRYGVPHDYYKVFRDNGSSRYIKTFTEMVSRFDRLDFIELHSLVMQRFSTTTPEGIGLFSGET